MSGPIIRKYGFPNHEQIFGSRPMEHGSEESASKTEPGKSGEPTSAKGEAPSGPKSADTSKTGK